MTKNSQISLFSLRVALGWLLLYAGLSKLTNPNWSAAGYLSGADSFRGLYTFFASPGVLPIINFLNVWGPILIGISLILGAFVKVSAIFGALMMLLYYLPILNFPMVGEHSFLVDEHIIYALVLIYLAVVNAGKYWGLDQKLLKK